MKIYILTIIAVLSWSLPSIAAPDNCEIFQKSVQSGSDSAKFKKFLDVQWKYLMTEYPEFATYVGYPGKDDRLTDLSAASVERRRKENVCALAALKKVKRSGLSANDKISLDLALRNAEISIEGDKFDGDYMPINHMSGFQVDGVSLFTSMPAVTVAHYENMLKRFDALPMYISQVTDLMREGIKRKAMPVKDFMPTIANQLNELLAPNPENSPYFAPFKNMNVNLRAEDQTRLKARAKEILTTKVYPALTQFKAFFDKEYAPQGRTNIAWTEMRDGKAWYNYLIKYHTTTSTNADQLHELGLSEVKKLTEEMEKVRMQVKFKGDLQAFNKHLLKDKQFYFKTKEELLSGYRDIAKRIDPELPKLFRTLPRLTYGVREIPEYAAKGAAGAQYVGGSLEAGRPGYFEANTSDLPSRPKYEMETLTMHEAVPGHHFQISLAAEVKDLPEFRKFGGFTAYTEGWALYAETLGKEMGFFKDPYAYYGHLSGQMLRAVRLVVDTGMHAKGWSKEKALTYYRSQMPTSDADSESEINRYISWPGQALAYKVGALKIREMRDRAATKLGAKFDVRDFHDKVLLQGALPMDVLETVIDEWTAGAVRDLASTAQQSKSKVSNKK